jgi:xanthine dehydrogenase YagS FAD-binding subunit
MPAFELFQPTTLDAALALLDRHNDAWIMAGGLDSFDWLKDRIRKPSVVIDMSALSDVRGIKANGDGVEIGALTTLTTVATDATLKQKYRVLSVAAGLVASPQIRNVGTLGGNIAQDARCWYYRAGWDCYRAGGNICYADTPESLNREHAIFDADRCVAVNPSDTAPALVALDAQIVIKSVGGERVVAAEDFFIGPGIDIMRLNVVRPGEMITAIRLPGTWAGATFYFEKVRDRNVWDFALVNVASAVKLSGDTISDIRLAVNGVAARPMRMVSVETAVKGRARNEETAAMAGQLAVQGAVPLAHNAYKIPLTRNLVKRAIRGSEDATWTS